MNAPLTTCTTRLFAAMSAAGLMLLLSGCASTQLDAQWKDPQRTPMPLRGAKVLLVCEADEAVVKRICQDQLAHQVMAMGATPVTSAELVNAAPGRPPAPESYLPAARSAGAQAVFSTHIAPQLTTDRPTGVSIGVGIGGGLGGRGFGGIGVSAPLGGGQRPVTAGYAANSVLTDVSSGRLMWTAKASTPSSDNLAGQIGDLSRTVVEAAQKAGFF
jgi:hypothetical protein